MAKRRKPTRRKNSARSPYHSCMSGTKKKPGQIHKERVRIMNKKKVKTLTPKQSGLALSNAAKVCKT